MPDAAREAALALLKGSRNILSVADLTHQVKEQLEGGFANLWLSGEVSNLGTPASGHIYLTLKDDQSQIRAVIWRGTARYLSERPQNGDQVLCRGRLTVYEPRGEYQFVVDFLEPAGTGALFRQIEQVKLRLDAEGLFDAARKQPLPALPRRIAVITSPSGAALRDILQVLKRRAPGLSVIVIPVQVQGNAAVQEIVDGFAQLSGRPIEPPLDAVILARGGGSLEDLMAFNDERVVRAIANCPLPVVCGVGHETDTTLADFAADLRAPTPSAAAEQVSVAWEQLGERLTLQRHRLTQVMETRLESAMLRVRAARAGLVDPRERLRHLAQRMDDLRGQLETVMAHRLTLAHGRQNALSLKLSAATPKVRMARQAQHTAALTRRLERAVTRRVERAGATLAETGAKLQELSPLDVLGRGYSITRQNGQLLRRTQDTAVGAKLQLRLHDGELDCVVENTRPLKGVKKPR